MPPKVLDDQAVQGGIEVKAVDKAGNIRLGTYVPGAVPPRMTGPEDYMTLIVILLLFAIALFVRHYLNTKEKGATVDLRT